MEKTCRCGFSPEGFIRYPSPKLALFLPLPAIAAIAAIALVTALPSPYDPREFDHKLAQIGPGRCHIESEVKAILEQKTLRERLYPIIAAVAHLTSLTKAAHVVRFGSPIQFEQPAHLHRQMAANIKIPEKLLAGPVATRILKRIEQVTPVPVPPDIPPSNLNETSNPTTLAVEGFALVYGFGRRQDFKRGIQLLSWAAKKGNAIALGEIGYFHSVHSSTLVDIPSKFYRLTRMAAQCGASDAMFNLGAMYDDGVFVPMDKKMAMEWWTKSAKKGLTLAAYTLGQRYDFGSAPDGADMAKAIRWYEVAARRGHIPSAINLNVKYDRQESTDRDDRFLERPLRLGAVAGIEYAVSGLAKFYLRHRNVTKAIRWLKISAEEYGNEWAAAKLGDFYREGNGIAANQAESAKWYKMGADLGSAYAATRLLAASEGRSQGETSALRTQGFAVLLKLAEKGDPDAMRTIARRYAIGDEDVAANQAESIKWYAQCAQANDLECISFAGHGFLMGTGVPADHQRAVTLLEKGAAMDDPYSAELLAVAYGNGMGVPRDLSKAERLFLKAANSGSRSAATELAKLYQMQGNVAKASEWQAKASSMSTEYTH